MDLVKFQKESQKSDLKKLDEDFQKRQYISKAIGKLSKRLTEYKKKHLFEVAKKIINENENDFLDILEIDLKNIDDRIAKPLTNALIDSIDHTKIRYKDYMEEIASSAKKLKHINMDKFEKIFDLFKELVFYSRKNFHKYYTNKYQESAFFVYDIKSTLIAKILLIDSLKLCTVTYDEENLQNTWQNVAQTIFFSLKKYIKFEADFDEENEQEIGGAFIELLIDEGYLVRSEEEKEKNYVTLRVSERFIKNLKGVIESLVVKTIYTPMVVKPEKWKGVRGGGFLHFEGMDENFDLTLIKAYTKKEKEYVDNAKIPSEMLDAINFLQEVGYKIDKNLLKKLKELKKQIDEIEKSKKINARIYLKVLFELKNEFELAGVKDFKDAEVYFLKKEEDYFKEKFERKYKNTKKLLKNISKDVFNLNKNKEELKIYKTLYELAKFDTSFDTIISIADKYKDFDSIYFVWQMDFRGRLYPVQTLLNPQGTDFVRALLVFDKEKEVKDINWFKIHGANLFGKDKESFEKRIKWIDENEDKILSVSEGSEFWMEADKPFEFYQFCLEYAKYKKDPKNFKTSIPIAVDGSNNGLQHISTMLRDRETAKRVNVLPTERVNDVYMDVLKKFSELLRNDILDSDVYFKKIGNYKLGFKKEKKVYKIREDLINLIKKELSTDETLVKLKKYGLKDYEFKLAKDILEKCQNFLPNDKDVCEMILEKENKKLQSSNYRRIIEEEKFVPKSLNKYVDFSKFNRKFIKKPVMIDSYGAGRKNKAEKIKEEIESWFDLDEKYIFDYALYLARLVDKAIDDIIPSASLYDNYMKKIVDIILKDNNKPIKWKTPLGFEVVQIEYEKKRGKPIKFRNSKITYTIETDKIDKEKQKSGISPNFIHSLDATHLYMTLLELKQKGITHIRPIHDSFAVFADDMENLQKILKEEFIKIYSKDILKEFIGFIKKNYKFDEDKFKKKLEKLTRKKARIVNEVSIIVNEDFDLKEIKNSKYMFS
jgi:hypothetical protein